MTTTPTPTRPERASPWRAAELLLTEGVRPALDAWWSQSDRTEGADPGVARNRRLTSVTGAVQIAVLAAVILSGLVFGWSPALHFFLGFAAIPLTLLKLGSTGYRFLQYYAVRSTRYRAAGPPALLPRALGPVLVVSAVVAFVSGVVLFFMGSRRGDVATLHTDSAAVFILAVGLHASVHLRSAWEESAAELRLRALRRPADALRGTLTRSALVGGAVVAGLVLAVALTFGYHWSLPPEQFDRILMH